MRLALALGIVGALSLAACGDDETGGAGGSGGAGGGGTTTSTTTSTTTASTGTAGEGGGTGGTGQGGEGGEGGGTCEENGPECVGCAQFVVDPNAGFDDLCVCNGPPSSADIFNNLVTCLCDNCGDVCVDTCGSGAPPEGECATCFEEACPTEIEMCDAD